MIRDEWRDAAVRLVARGSGDPRRPSRTARPAADPSGRPGRAGEHGLGREVPAGSAELAGWGACDRSCRIVTGPAGRDDGYPGHRIAGFATG